KFYDDMFTSLYYIHFTRKYIHNDIKPVNIVIYLGSNIKETYYQLIDFGLLSKINSVNDQQRRVSGTMVFMKGTFYEKVSNIFYDWHCVLLSALSLLGFVHIVGDKFEYLGLNQGIYELDQANFEIRLRNYFKHLISTEKIQFTEELRNSLNK